MSKTLPLHVTFTQKPIVRGELKLALETVNVYIVYAAELPTSGGKTSTPGNMLLEYSL
jgi:hypothetical protein